MTERVRPRMQVAEMSSLRRMAGFILRDRVRSSDLHAERNRLEGLDRPSALGMSQDPPEGASKGRRTSGALR